MASYVFSCIFTKNNHKNISAIFIIDLITGDSKLQKIKRLADLIEKSSLSFAFYKLFETKFFMFYLKLMKYIKKTNITKIEDLGKFYEIPVYFYENVNDTKFINKINEIDEAAFSIFTIGQIVKKDTLENLHTYPINCHGSYLPEMKGPAQYIWYFVNNLNYFGVTFHKISPQIDSGEILHQNKFDIPNGISSFVLHYLIAKKWGEEIQNLITTIQIPPTIINQYKSKESILSLPDRKAFRLLKDKRVDLVNFKDLNMIINDLNSYLN